MPLPTLLDLVQRSAAWLAEKGVSNARREAEWIFAETLGLSRLDLYTRFDMPLAEPEVARLRALVQRRGHREPLAYVLGIQPFCGLRLAVSPAVLVPRPETEELVERVLAGLPAGAQAIADIGTGSGAIALALRKARPDCPVSATDASADALAVARANAASHGLEVAFHAGHLATPLQGTWARVVANLPYVPDGERDRCDPELASEPAMALFRPGDGLDLIGELMADAPRLLAEGGELWLEHGDRQGAGVAALAARAGLACEILTDRQGLDRFARVRRP